MARSTLNSVCSRYVRHVRIMSYTVRSYRNNTHYYHLRDESTHWREWDGKLAAAVRVARIAKDISVGRVATRRERVEEEQLSVRLPVEDKSSEQEQASNRNFRQFTRDNVQKPVHVRYLGNLGGEQRTGPINRNPGPLCISLTRSVWVVSCSTVRTNQVIVKGRNVLRKLRV